MHKRFWMSILMAAALMALLVISVTAQNTVLDDEPALDEGAAALFAIEPVTATVDQQVPISLTLRIPLGPTETQTVTVPLLLSLNLQLTLGEFVSPAVAITAGVAPLTDVVTTTLPTTLAVAPPTATPLPSPTPTAPPPTPTPPLPTPTPIPAPAEESEATPAPEVESEAEPETEEPSAPEEAIVVVPECADPRSVIVFPGVNQVVSGVVDLVGSATHESFSYYKLEYALGADAGSQAEYFYFGGGNSPLENGLLAQFDSTAVPNGAYTLRLTVVDSSGNFPTPCPVTVQVAN